MIRGIHHVAISTPDIERILGFYRDLLGFEEIGRVTWGTGAAEIDRVLDVPDTAGTSVMLKAGNTCIEIFQFANPEPAPMTPRRPVIDHGHTHMCIDVTDIDAVYAKLSAAGIEFHCPVQYFTGEMHLKATYGRDPDGNVFEIQELMDADSPFQVIGTN